jgi:HEAT repeat protein
VSRRAAAALVALVRLASANDADAQTRPAKGSPPALAPGPPETTTRNVTTDLRARFGTEIATRLARSGDPDERLRGIERAAAVRTPEGLALLERAARAGVQGTIDPHSPLDGVARTDPRALLVVVRGLAAWLDREPARAALTSIVKDGTQSFASHAGATPGPDPSADDAEGAARVLLARQEAAMALAQSGALPALEALIAIARSAGPGQGPALDAIAAYPPAPLLLGGVVLTTPATVALAVEVGDLRSLDAIEAAMSASDPSLRAAALVALGVAGDSRIANSARAALRDRDARVRLAAGDALVRLGTPDSGRAVEGLVGDDATALDGLRLAQLVQGDGVTKAAAARAVASANADVRGAAVAALGRQASVLAVGALSALVADPAMQGDAACAMARSPSSAAMAAIESMAGTAPLRRLAARAYLVRRWVRGERSAKLDSLLEDLARSNDARDRAVGMQALVTLGKRPIAQALQDSDPRVRRTAATGALAHWDGASRSALLARMGMEPDEVTRQVLALGLLEGDVDGLVPTADLVDRVRGGGPDAPLAALALAQRDDPERATDIDVMLQSHDPVLREHIARGLGASAARDAAGRLARAYAKEGDVRVRRAIVAALATRTGDALAPARRSTLEVAAGLDPDRVARWTASRALSGATATRREIVREVAWLRLTPAEGAALPRDVTAALLPGEGVALPIAFDDDGYALVPGVAPGGARLRLAPRLPPYEAPSP